MDDLRETQLLTATVALNKMFKQSYFDICTIDKVAKMLGIHTEKTSYNILHTLHCVHYNEMPPELVAKLPGLVKQTLDMPTAFQFDTLKPKVITINSGHVEDVPEPKKGKLRLAFWKHD